MRIPDDNLYRDALNQLSGASRENAVLYSLSSPWRRSLDTLGFNRLSLALPNSVADSDQNAAVLGQWYKPRLPQWKRPGWSPSHDLWADIYHSYTHLSADGNAPGGHGNRGGFFAGTALSSPSKESLLGISLGYSAAQYQQGRDKTDIGDFQIGLYGGANLFGRNLQLRGYLGYGMLDYKHHRAVQIGQYEPLAVTGKADADSVSAAL